MEEQPDPLLSQYFGSVQNVAAGTDENKIQLEDEVEAPPNVDDTITNTKEPSSSTQSTKDEPVVCRLFSDAQQKSKDPTASFFDIIGSTSTNKESPTCYNDKGIIADLGIPAQNDDGYGTRIAAGSETDRRRDAWIPSERTRQCLIACVTSPAGSYCPDKESLTMPGVLLEEELNDSVGEAVVACLGEAEASQRRSLTANDVTQDERGLRELVQAGAYRAAINLTARLLTIYGQGGGRAGNPSKHSPHSLQLWFTRIALLVKSKAFNIAQAEAEPFEQLDKPDVFYQFYPEMYGGRPGSIASFSFRLLLAELPMHCGKSKDSLTHLFNILCVVRQILENLGSGFCEDGNPMEISAADRSDSIRLWSGREVRVMHSIVNCALSLKDYELSVDILRQLCERKGAPKCALLSALGRLHLQLGDIAGAEVCFSESKELSGGDETADLRGLVDQGLLSVAQNAFDVAYTLFQQASVIEPNNVMILNNMAVCLLYSGNLKQAISVLESAVSVNPVHALHESLLLNLCTLYDMESSKGRMKKFALLRQISKYQADAPTAILEKLYG